MRPNLILVGFMGTGKSAVGRRLALRLNLEFIDMDLVIEARQHQPISRIFAERGEPAFRALERELVRELAPPAGRVIATGGGVVLDPRNIEDFQSGGLVVCLTATPDILLARVAHHRNRPLLEAEDRRQRLVDLLEQRRPLYEAITPALDTSSQTPDQIAAEIAARYEPFCRSFPG
jgi:shikimate kinase